MILDALPGSLFPKTCRLSDETVLGLCFSSDESWQRRKTTFEGIEPISRLARSERGNTLRTV